MCGGQFLFRDASSSARNRSRSDRRCGGCGLLWGWKFCAVGSRRVEVVAVRGRSSRARNGRLWSRDAQRGNCGKGAFSAAIAEAAGPLEKSAAEWGARGAGIAAAGIVGGAAARATAPARFNRRIHSVRQRVWPPAEHLLGSLFQAAFKGQPVGAPYAQPQDFSGA
jgi:hypothetical protein